MIVNVFTPGQRSRFAKSTIQKEEEDITFEMGGSNEIEKTFTREFLDQQVIECQWHEKIGNSFEFQLLDHRW